MGAELVRTIASSARDAKSDTNLVYNMRRFVCLETTAAAGRTGAPWVSAG
jgi:hypothetical protein